MTHDVYLLSGEFALPQGQDLPLKVFRTEREDRAFGGSPSLEHLLTSAGQRALAAAGLPLERLRPHITHLLATTMPEVKLEEMNLGLLSTRLKNTLELPSTCQARFEVGSSDAGASAFATAWEATREAQSPRTTLVLAGQVMPGGSEAIRAISKVLEPAERRLGLTMLAVGDLYMDLFARGWGLEELAYGLVQADEPGERTAALRGLIERLTQVKLELAREYGPANRSGDVDFGPWSTHWFRVGHVAPATSGGAAILMSNDPALVLQWARARGPGARLVRVLGVSEGEQETAVTRRPHPLSFVKSIRQALSALGMVAGVNLNGLRSSSFALLHDAFLSIELAFLMGLGMLPLEAVQKQLSFWPNPYGGLTSFGHAIGASGLVQVVKAFQIFTHPTHTFQRLEHAPHPRFDLCEGRTQALATSVGGPLSHVVAVLLEAVPPGTDAAGRACLPPHFLPPARHRFDPAVDGDLPEKASWVAKLFARYLECYAQTPGLGLLEARTSIDLRTLARPLPAAFLEQWNIPPIDTSEGQVKPSEDFLKELRDLLALPIGREEKGGGAVAEIFAREARRHLTELERSGPAPGPGQPALQLEDPAGLEARSKVLRDNLLAAVRPWVGLVAATDPGVAGGVRRLALLSEQANEAEPGSIVRFLEGAPYPVVTALEPSLPGWVPLWELLPSRLKPPFAILRLGPRQVRPVVEALLTSNPGRSLWQRVRELAEDVVTQALEQPALCPPPAAVRLLRALVLMPDPMPERVAECLELLACDDHPRHMGRPERVAYCLFDLVGALKTPPSELSHRLGVVARVIRRSEAWLNYSEVNLEQSGDRFFATCALSDASPEQEAWVAMLRFARDVYQEALARGILLRAGVCVGEGLRFAGIDGGFSATGFVVTAVQGVLRLAPEARRGLRARSTSTLDMSSGPDPWRGDGVFLAGKLNECPPDFFNQVWQDAGGEVLEVVGQGKLEARPGDRDIVAYQYRARRAGTPLRLEES